MVGTPQNRSLTTLLEDLITTAKLTQAPYSEATLRRVLRNFEDGFLKGSVQFRSTSKPVGKRDLCFRYLDLESGQNPLDIAETTGELADTSHPIFDWLRQVQKNFPALGWGADFEAQHGLAKIWYFIDGAYDPEAFLDLPQMPRCFYDTVAFLREMQLDSATIVGIDCVNASINLYFRPSHPTHQGPQLLTQACKHLGFEAPSEAALAHVARSGCIAFTFGWDAPQVERICFYAPGFGRQDVASYPPHLQMFAQNAPALVEQPHFIVGWSHGLKGQYFKIEDDYTGDVSNIFRAAMSVAKVPLTR